LIYEHDRLREVPQELGPSPSPLRDGDLRAVLATELGKNFLLMASYEDAHEKGYCAALAG